MVTLSEIGVRGTNPSFVEQRAHGRNTEISFKQCIKANI